MNQKRKIFPFWRVKTTTVSRVVFFLTLFLLFFIFTAPVYAQNSQIIAGRVFFDLNASNNLDLGEEALAGWKVKIIQNGEVVKTAISDSQGLYRFDSVLPGKYSLEIEEKPGWENVSQRSFAINFSGQENIQKDFGLYQTLSQTSGWSPMIKISDIKVEVLGPTSAKITWFSSHKTAGQVIYGFTNLNSQAMSESKIDFGYDYSSAVDFSAQTYHQITLNNLKPSNHYYFRVVSYPDVNQWPQASFLISDGLVFETPKIDLLAEGSKTAGQNKESTKTEKTGLSESKYPGQVLSVELDESEIAQRLAETQSTSTESKVGMDSKSSNNCLWSIVFLLALNLLALLAVWFVGEKSAQETKKKIWWINLILIVVPSILAFPECWLNFWLLLTLLISVVYLGSEYKLVRDLWSKKAESPKEEIKK